MCGIAGFAGERPPESIETTVRSMMASLARRGPDSDGFEAWSGAGLGHRRLAILDLSAAGHQPMLSEDRSIGLVFNGCIYNFLELKAELEQEGRRFRSRCDTEVLLHGYQAWGIDKLVARVRGMFAFAVWDQPRRTLSLVRDRLGVKPLVYSVRDGGITFASTVKALQAGGCGGELNTAAVLEFLEYGNVAGHHSIFQGCQKLPPATILEWKDGKLSQRVYWSLPAWQEPARIRFEEAVEETERLLIEATRLRLVSDVPISALLSGGVDSTLVCWALAELNANLTAYTVGAPGDASDETAQARHTAAKLGIPHEVVNLPPEPPDSLQQVTGAFSEPFASSSAHALLRVSKVIREKATVVLSGDGGDEAYLGYPFFQYAWQAQQLARRMPAPLAAAVGGFSGLLPRQGLSGRARNFLSYATGGLKAFVSLHDNAGMLRRQGVLGERFHGAELPKDRLRASLESARNLLPEVLAFQNEVYFVGEFLEKVDGATMYHSLEARAPFLDQKLWEFAATLPPSVRLQGGVLKAVLREIVRQRVGPEAANRPKQGFTVPVESWLAGRWSGALDVLRQPGELARQGWVQQRNLEAALERAVQRGSVPLPFWHLLVLERWLRQ